MLSIYRRHREGCPQASDRASKKCRCSLWFTGTLSGEPYRKSAKTRNLEAAEKFKRQLESGTAAPEKVTLKDAITQYRSDCEARKLSPSTRHKNAKLLAALAQFADSKRRRFLEDIGTAELRQFRSTWVSWGKSVQRKQIERLRTFFRFCIENKWISESPAQFLKPPEIDPPDKVQVFTEEELAHIHETIKHPIMRAFVLTLQHTGLRISDAVQLSKELIKNGKLSILTKKKKVLVELPLPPVLLAALDEIKTTQYYFWTGESKLSTVIGSKRRGLAKLLKRAAVSGNPHKFRHTLATTLLSNGTSPAIVAKILGNSEKVILKYYDHWIPSRQKQLEGEIQKTWTPAKLVRVK